MYNKVCINNNDIGIHMIDSIGVSEGEFYIGSFVLLKFVQAVVTGSMNSNTKPPM